MRTFTSNKALVDVVKNTPKSQVAIFKGDIIKCSKCGSVYTFTSEIKGKETRAIKHHLHHAHALDCPTYTPVNRHAGVRRAIRQAVINSQKGKGDIYDAKRYKVVIVGNAFIVIDKANNITYRAYYEGRKLKIERVWG